MSALGANYLEENALLFASEVAKAMAEMVSAELEVDRGSYSEGLFEPGRDLVVQIFFTGLTQGEYALSLDEESAHRLFGITRAGMDAAAYESARIDFTDMLKEILNVAVGCSIPPLEEAFAGLTFLPAVSFYGPVSYPEIPAGRVRLVGPGAGVSCWFLLNRAKLGVGEILSILDEFPAGLMMLDRYGSILPGYSKMTTTVLDLPGEASLSGKALIEALGPACIPLADDFRAWLGFAFEKYGVTKRSVIDKLCPLQTLTLASGKDLRLDWIPIASEYGKSLAKYMVVVHDVTETNRLQRKMERLRKQHDENLEILANVLSLGHDVVAEFLQDCRELLAQATALARGDMGRPGRADDLDRAVHTLKGLADQNKFASLQKMAHRLEEEIHAAAGGTLPELAEHVDEMGSYLDRISDVYLKLNGRGGGDGDAGDAAGIKAPLGRIRDLFALVEEERRSLPAGPARAALDALLGRVGAGILSLGETGLASLKEPLERMAGNVAARAGKQFALQIPPDGSVAAEVLAKLRRAFVHLINNAIDHGIEDPRDRLAAGKPAAGRLSLSAERCGDDLLIRFRDDGRGIDMDSVRQRLVEKGLMGAAEAALASPQELLKFVFQPGFSTRRAVSEISGRGVGMDAVAHVVNELGGRVEIRNSPGRGTDVRMFIPLRVASPSQWAASR
ncbi:MAG TPA: sensor histidine kinase [Fibrobacteria bacterium]|nr:sensor histidine kinase [Fibrobacteria bacterium]